MLVVLFDQFLINYYLINMKTEQINALTNLSDELKIKAHLPQNTKRYSNLLFIADSATLLAMGNKEGSERLIELVNPKGDKEIENAMLKYLKILLEIV